MSIVEILIGRREFSARSERVGGQKVLITTDIYEPPHMDQPLLIEPEYFESADSARAKLQFRKLINLTATLLAGAFTSTVITGVSSEVSKGKDIGAQELIFLTLAGLSFRLALDRVLEAKKSDVALKSLDG